VGGFTAHWAKGPRSKVGGSTTHRSALSRPLPRLRLGQEKGTVAPDP
jgi:hypothetical protein